MENEKKMIGGVDCWGNIMACQAMIDRKYIQANGLKMEELKAERQLALIAEMMEYADETRCFKYWNKKEPADGSVRLEEIADVIHFYASEFNRLLMMPEEIGDYSHGLDLKLPRSGSAAAKEKIKRKVISEQIRKAIQHLLKSGDEPIKTNSRAHLGLSFAHFMTGARLDGFDELQIERAYYEKNKKNQERKDHNC